ncbi:cytochrome P450 [Xylaria sp. FL1777]|nr:cytochrome P450 [Xylaria sp. FL1777]
MRQSMRALFSRLQEEYACARNGIGPLRLTKTELLGLFLRKPWLDLQRAWDDASPSARIASLILFCCLAILAVERVSAPYRSLTRRGFPLLRRPKRQNRWDFQAKLEEGARMFPDTPYIIRCDGHEQIVYPSSMFDEIKALPVTQASLMEYFAHTIFEGWRFLEPDNSALHGAIGVDLVRSLPTRVREKQDRARKAFDQVLGPCPEWKSVRLYGTIQQLVTLTNVPALVGLELGTDPRWLRGLDMLIYSLMFALFVIGPVPRVFRPIAKFIAFGPNWWVYWRLKRVAHPTVVRDLGRYSKRENSHEEAPELSSKDEFRVGSRLALRYKTEDCTADRLAHDLIATMFESLMPMIRTLCLIISELVLRPELADELRAELRANLSDGQLPMSQLNELSKMDSFMREAIRTNFHSYMIVFRRVMKPVKLSAGPEVPAGALICVDAYNMVQSQTQWEDPVKFDPKRFLKMRQKPGSERLHQFASLDSNMPTWGGGPQACPGRVFATNSMKVLLAHLLLNYDIKLPSGASKPSVVSSPNGAVMPDLMARILVKGRKESSV